MRLVLLPLLAQSSCRLLLPAAGRPVPRLEFEPAQAAPEECVILLPGRYSVPQEFVSEGIVRLVQKRRPAARIVVPDLHLRYYMERTAGACLWEEMIRPAREAGLKVSLLGVSMGGLGALVAWLEHAEAVDEVLLLAPYLGEPELIREIRQAGGLARWKGGVDRPTSQEQAMRFLWERLRARGRMRDGSPVRLRLACGLQDRHLEACRLFAESLLPEGHALELPGHHDWPTWRRACDWLLA